MKFLQGNEEQFLEAIKSIKENDKVGVFTHNDTDGITSALFFKEMIKRDLDFLKVKSHGRGLWENIKETIKKKDLTRIFIFDLSVDDIQMPDFELLMKNKNIIYLDHHPISPKAEKIENVIRVDSNTGVGFLLFQIGAKNNLINFEEWKSVGIGCGIAEHSFRDEENFQYMKKAYPDINKENIFESEPGEIANKISSALIYYSEEKEKVYEFLIKKDFKSIEKASVEIKKEIKRCLDEFKEKATHYKEKDIYFYHTECKFKVSSMLSSIIAKKYPDSIILNSKFDEEYVKVSARNFNANQNVRNLLANLLKNLEGSSTGGHTCAAGGRFYKKDFKKFKENLENYNKNL